MAANLDADCVAEDQPIRLAFQAAEWQYHYAFQPDESTELWERIIALVDHSNQVVQQSKATYRTRASEYIGMIHFSAAKTALNAGRDPSAHIAKLEKIAKHRQGSKQYYRASYPTLMLGMWLHNHSKIDEESWRACIRPPVKQALYLLSDEDPWNDQSACAQLGQALLPAGDTLNASIALGITTQPWEEHRNLPHMPKEEDQPKEEEDLNQDKLSSAELVPIEMATADEKSGTNTEKSADPQVKEPNKSFDQDVSNHDEEDKAPSSVPEKCSAGEEGGMGNDTESLASPSERGDDESNEEGDSINPKYAGFDLIWDCDGPCNARSTPYTELYFCRICHYVCFCEKCIELIRNDQLPFGCCASDHPRVRIYPMIEEAKLMTAAVLERKFEVQQGWLDELKKVWDN